jgi:hypothetical protein
MQLVGTGWECSSAECTGEHLEGDVVYDGGWHMLGRRPGGASRSPLRAAAISGAFHLCRNRKQLPCATDVHASWVVVVGSKRLRALREHLASPGTITLCNCLIRPNTPKSVIRCDVHMCVRCR